MTPQMMRQLWSVVENAHSQTLLQMDDNSLVHWLVKQTTTQALLEGLAALDRRLAEVARQVLDIGRVVMPPLGALVQQPVALAEVEELAELRRGDAEQRLHDRVGARRRPPRSW